MDAPNTYTDKNETGCCAVPNVADWDNQEVVFEGRHFIRMHTRSFLFVPLNMGRVMTALHNTATQANATMPAQQAMILSHDLSPWKAEQLYGVSEPVEGADNVTLNGTFLTKVFEGPYKDAKTWYQTMQQYVTERGKKVDTLYFFYTTCPKCAKHYGKNYVYALAKVA